jgi:tRNA (guanine37-N1)-methyltransferase
MGLPEDLQGHLPETLRRLVPRRYDVVGDIAVLSLPGELRGYGPGIAEVIRTKRNHIKTVLNKATMIGGENRTASFEVLAGSSTVTTHREFGIPYRLDLARVFFNPCLAYERNRVAMQAIAGETVLVPFAGIGPFVLPLAKRGVFVVAIEKNPDAVRWLRENLLINKAESRVDVREGDATTEPSMGTGCTTGRLSRRLTEWTRPLIS